MLQKSSVAPAREKRSTYLMVRLRPSEAERIKALAERRDLSAAELARQALAAACREAGL